MGKTKKLVIGLVATAAGAAGAGVLLHKSAGRKKAEEPGPGPYRGSHRSKTLHQTGCRYYDSKKLTRVFRDLGEALGAGYRPCKICIE